MLVVVGAELVLLCRRGRRRRYRRRPKPLRGVARPVRGYLLTDVALHLDYVRLTDLYDLDVLQRVERAGVVVREDELPADAAVRGERVRRRVEVHALDHDVRLDHGIAAGVLYPLAALDLYQLVGSEELHELPGEVDRRSVPGRLGPEHLQRPAARRAGRDVGAVRRRAFEADPPEDEASAGLDIHALADVVEDELGLLCLV